MYIHPRRAVFEPLYTLFEKWRKARFSLENELFSAILRVGSKVVVFPSESPALTAELPDRRVAVGWCDGNDAAGSELSIVAEGWSGGRAGGVARLSSCVEVEVTE